MPDGEEHITVTYTPEVHEVERYSLPCEPIASVLQTALGTIITAIWLVAERAYMLLVTLLNGWLVVLLLPFQPKPIFGKDIHYRCLNL